MSHSVHMVVAFEDEDRNNLLESCDIILKTINDCQKQFSNINLLNQFSNEINKINDIKEQINKGFSFSYNDYNKKDLENIKRLNIQLAISNINKQLINLSYLTASQLKEFDSNNFDFNFVPILLNYGEIAYEAINNLTNNNIDVTEKSLTDEIDRIRNLDASKEAIIKFRKDCIDIIKNVFPNNINIQDELFKKCTSISVNNELADFKAYVYSKKSSLVKIKNLAQKIYSSLESLNENYMQIGKSITKINDDGTVKVIYKFGNKYKETFDISIDENLQISYKIGDYERYCCQKTSENIINYLNKHGAKVVKFNVVREFQAAKPKYKSIQKISSKTKEAQ
ncbi:hypothetical protein [Mycoplasmopsis adleri]|uniref:hypothetical protein n=1 Tax=Mycoplasmopsis adleri TaxID=51362 RepID=UPI00387305D7